MIYSVTNSFPSFFPSYNTWDPWSWSVGGYLALPAFPSFSLASSWGPFGVYQAGPWGYFSWSSSFGFGPRPYGFADAAAGVGRLASRWIPHGQERAYMDQRILQNEERRRMQEAANGTQLFAPPAPSARAMKYFNAIRNGRNPTEAYSSNARKAISEAENEEAKYNPNVKGREGVLLSLISLIRDRYYGDNYTEMRAKFKGRRPRDSRERLFALVAPEADKPEGAPQEILQRIAQQLGPNRMPSEQKASAVFDAYYQMLLDRFGPEADSTIDMLYSEVLGDS